MVDGRPYHISVVNQFMDQIRHGVQGIYAPSVYRMPSSDEEEISRCIENMIMRNEVDVILTIGRACTVYAKAVAKRHNNFPLIFVGVLDPVGEGIVDSIEKPGGNLTGAAFESAPTEGLVNGITALHPDIHSVMIPFLALTKSGKLERQAREIEERLVPIGIKVFVEPISTNYDKLMQLVESYRKKVNCILILDGCFSSIAHKPIAQIAWEECITHVGCSNYSIDSGAAASFSGDLNPLTAACYHQLEIARTEQLPLSAIPVKMLPDNREFTVNLDVMRQIGWSVESLERICKTKGIRAIRRWVAPPNGNY